MSDEKKAEAKTVKFNWGGLIGLLVLGGLLFQCVNSSVNSGSSTSHSNMVTAESPPPWTAPEGYTTTQTDNGVPFGIKWQKKPKCELGDWCMGVDIITSVNCPHFYASITLLDKSDTNIGWTNDSAQGVIAGEKASLTFNGYQSGVASGRIAETKCY